jgi:thiol:disulfide interchange protein
VSQRSVVPAAVGIVLVLIAGMAGWHLLSGRPAAVAALGSGWYEGAGGYDQAVADQRSSGKPVLVYFHTNWCGYCKRLDRDVFSTPAFGQRYGSILKVKINPDNSSAEKSLAQRYNLRGFPTVVVLASSRTSDPIVGYADAATFYTSLKQAIGD